MQPLISVIMSVYNEKPTEIMASVHSILEQSVSDFEFIIVVDTTDCEEVLSVSRKLELLDYRISVLYNDNNIGLAMSMNRAAAVSRGKYLARMDADDIADTTRFEKQLKCFEEGDYDLVFTDYQYIGENGEILPISHSIPTDEALARTLPYSNGVHHPTVMMKKSIFDEVGGYRDFPCAQDYDLWLRMYEHGARMHIIPEKLFFYRIRGASVTQSVRVKQFVTLLYIRKLYNERQIKGKDTFTKENYERYLKRNHVYDEKYCRAVVDNRQLKRKIDELRNNPLKKAMYVNLICCKCGFYRKYYIYNAWIKLRMKMGA